MTGNPPRDLADRTTVLERITARFVQMPPNGIDPPSDEDTIQLRIGTLFAETSWPEISELVGVPSARGDTDAVAAAVPEIQEAARRRHGLTRRLMIRVWARPELGERIMNRLRPGSHRDGQRAWLVWGERGGWWREEP
jgi:hypothetical protein